VPDIQSLTTDRAAVLIGMVKPEAQRLGWLLWGVHINNVGLEPSGRLRAFAEECVETGLLRRAQVDAVDFSLPGQRRARRVVKDTGSFGGNPRLEFAGGDDG